MHEAFDAQLRSAFPMPIASGAGTLEYAGQTTVEPTYETLAIFRLVTSHGVREERLAIDDWSYEDFARIDAFLAALAAILARGRAEALETCTPGDLIRWFATRDRETAQECERVLAEPERLGWLLAGEPPTTLPVEQLHALCREKFPMRGANELASLEYVSCEVRDTAVRIVLRLIVWQIEDERMSIRDVKEQELYLGDAGKLRDLSPLRAYFGGLARALARALGSPDIDTLMPHDLVRTDVLRLETRVTEDDFFKALSARSRLGRYMASGCPATPPVTTAEELAGICRERFPMRGTDQTTILDFVDATLDSGTLRLVLRSGGTEQAVGLATAGAYDRERISTFLDGLRTTLATTRADAFAGVAPSALVFPELLAKPKMITAADFDKALRAKARLGRFLAR